MLDGNRLLIGGALLIVAVLLVVIARRLGAIRELLAKTSPRALGQEFRTVLAVAAAEIAGYAHEVTSMELARQFRGDPGLAMQVPENLLQIVMADILADARTVQARLTVIRKRLVYLEEANTHSSIVKCPHTAEITTLEGKQRTLTARLAELRTEAAAFGLTLDDS